MVFGSHSKTRAIYSTPPCPSLAASTAAYPRRSFSDSQPKNRCIFRSTSAEYTSMPPSLIRDLLRGKDTTAQPLREVILEHILRSVGRQKCGPPKDAPCMLGAKSAWNRCVARSKKRGGSAGFCCVAWTTFGGGGLGVVY